MVLLRYFGKFLKSPKSAIVLAFLMIPILVVGTVVPQNESVEVYNSIFGKRVAQFLIKAKITDIYHAFYFQIIVFLFFISLAVANFTPLLTYISTLRKSGISKKLVALTLTRLFHITILVVFIGFITTALFKKEGILLLGPGDEKTLRGFPDYKIKLYNFWIDYIHYFGRIFVKDYYSDLELFKGDSSLVRDTIEVNFPIQYGKLKIYQSFYQQNLIVGIYEMDGRLISYHVLPTKNWTEINETGKIFYFDEFKTGRLTVYRGKEEGFLPFKVSVFTHENQGPVFLCKLGLLEGVRIGDRILRIEGFNQLSGLTYRVDPGAELVFLGTLISALGLVIAIFLRNF